MVDDDYDALLNARLPFVLQMLAKHGAFFPFGGYIEAGGEPVDAYLPCRKTTDGRYEYGELFLVRGRPRIFESAGSAG